MFVCVSSLVYSSRDVWATINLSISIFYISCLFVLFVAFFVNRPVSSAIYPIYPIILSYPILSDESYTILSIDRSFGRSHAEFMIISRPCVCVYAFVGCYYYYYWFFFFHSFVLVDVLLGKRVVIVIFVFGLERYIYWETKRGSFRVQNSSSFIRF